MDWWMPLAIAAGLSVVSYFSEHFLRFAKKAHDHLLSLSAGILIALLLYKLLPMLPGPTVLAAVSPAIVLLGFLGFYLAEDWIYQHGPRSKLIKDVNVWHAVGFSIDHAAIIGFTLVILADLAEPIELMIITIPFLIHVIASADSLGRIKRGIRAGTFLEILLSSMPFIGALITFWLATQTIALWAAFAYIIGALLYLTVRDVIPPEREDKPLWFVVGLALTVAALTVL
jgi:xanthosine utilization system XapX-like protein